MASVFKRRGRKGWQAAWFDHEGVRQERATGTTDKRLAERIAQHWADEALERKRGLVDPTAERLAEHRTTPLGEHIADFQRDLEALKRDDKHVASTIRCLERAAETLEWRSIADVRADALTAHLAREADARGNGARTYNASVVAWRSFARWCVRHGRVAADPLAMLAKRNTDTDRRRIRRDLTPDELARLIQVASASEWVTVDRRSRDRESGNVRSVRVRMHAPDRAWAYRIAAGTGFRASEVASLTPESFDLDADTPTVTVQAGYSKRKRRDVQPIRDDLAEALRPWLANKPKGAPVCPLPDGKAGLMLQADMAVARAAWIAEARTPADRDGRDRSDFLRPIDASGRVVDFHSLRHTYVSRLVESGASVKVAQELARHSTPTLTIGCYSHVRLHDLSAALANVPGPKSPTTPTADVAAMLPTGTDGRSGFVSASTSASSRSANQGEPLRFHAMTAGNNASARDARNPLHNADLDDSVRADASAGENRGRRIRTADLLTPSQTR